MSDKGEMMTQGGRRSRWACVLVVLALAALLAGACTSDSGTTGTPAGDLDAAADTEGAEGTTSIAADQGVDETEQLDRSSSVVIAFAVVPTSLDPHLAQVSDSIYTSLAYERLMEMSNSLEVQPMLATEWSYSVDSSAFDVTLRDGVMFHDGTPFNADAVVATIDRAKNLEGSRVAASLTQVTEVEAIDDTHVRFHLEGGPNNLAEILTGQAGAMISPAVIEDGSVDLVAGQVDGGTGPYTVDQFLPGQGATFTAADGYWDPDRQRAAAVTVEFEPDPQVLLDGLRAGDYDVVQIIGEPVPDAIAAAEAGEFRYLPLAQNTVFGMYLNPAEGDLQSQELRQAINYAVDRNDLADGAMGGYCENRVQPFPLGSKYFFPELEQRYLHDPDEARRLIEASGIENPEFDVLVPPGAFHTLAERTQAHLAEVGITMNIIEADLAGAAGWLAPGSGAQAGYLALLAYPDPGQLLQNDYLRVPVWFPPGETTEMHERAAAAAALGVDESERLDAYRSIFADLNERAFFVPGCANTQIWAWQHDIIGVDSMPNLWSGAVAPYTIGRIAPEE